MDMKKELEDFALRFGGALLGMEESATTEIIQRTVPGAASKFPYSWLPATLAPGDNFIVGGLAIPPWVIGYLLEEDGEKKNDAKTKAMGEALRKFGEGDIIYSWSMILHHTLIRNIPQTWVLQSRAGHPPPGSRGSGGNLAAVVTKL
jgi:hypothetical protein